MEQCCRGALGFQEETRTSQLPGHACSVWWQGTGTAFCAFGDEVGIAGTEQAQLCPCFVRAFFRGVSLPPLGLRGYLGLLR